MTTTPRGRLAPAICIQGSCHSMVSWSWARAVRVASSVLGRAPLWTYSLTAPPALPPVLHHPAAPLHEAPCPHLPHSSSRPAGLSAGLAAGPALVLVLILTLAASRRTAGGAPSPVHLTDVPPPGLITTRIPALFIPGLTKAPTLSFDLLSAAGQGMTAMRSTSMRG